MERTRRDDGDREALAWLAFRYLAGELPPGEAEAFEARMGRDLAACEALAGAVELSGAVGSAVPTLALARPSGRGRVRRLAMAAAGLGSIAAGLLVGIALREARTDRAVRGRDAEEVVRAWADLRREPSSEPDWLDGHGAVAVAEAGDGDPEGGLPSWMVEVAALDAEDSAPFGVEPGLEY